MDSELIFFLILAAISLISNLLNKRKKQQQERRRRSAQGRPANDDQSQTREKEAAEERERKPFSFEDLLKEFESEFTGRETAEHDEAQPSRRQEQRSEGGGYDEEVEEAESLEQLDSPYDRYEGTSFKELELDNLENLKVGKSGYGRSSNYSIKKKVPNEYSNKLRTSKGLKEAFIMSEILKRKF